MKFLTMVLVSLTALTGSTSAATNHHRWWQRAVASDYGDGTDGQLGNRMGCGGVLTSSSRVVANKSLPCGTRLRICFRGCVTAYVEDRGPYVAGRDFDLAYFGVARVIGFRGVGVIRWRRL